MRRRKILMPLTLDNLSTALKPGRPYTIEAFALMFDASPAAIAETVDTALAAGIVHASREVRGFRRTYWTPVPNDPQVTARRWQAADMRGELVGYTDGLSRFVSLCLSTRRV